MESMSATMQAAARRPGSSSSAAATFVLLIDVHALHMPHAMRLDLSDWSKGHLAVLRLSVQGGNIDPDIRYFC